MRNIRFILIGEDIFARKTAEIINSDSNGSLVHVYTTMERVGTLHRFCDQLNIPVSNSQLLRLTPPPILDADWLINVNSAVLLPTAILDQFPYHALNLHNGPLPEYAGRHVHQWGIRNGETKFAATIHHMATGIDTGDIVLKKEFLLNREDTGLSAFRKSFETGVIAFSEVLKIILSGETLPSYPQDLEKRKEYKHRDAVDSRIDWSLSARQVCDFVRAGNYLPLSSPTYTASISDFNKEIIEVFKAEPCFGIRGIPGEIQIIDNVPVVTCGNDAVALIDTRRGGKKMTIDDWKLILHDNAGRILSGRTTNVSKS